MKHTREKIAFGAGLLVGLSGLAIGLSTPPPPPTAADQSNEASVEQRGSEAPPTSRAARESGPGLGDRLRVGRPLQLEDMSPELLRVRLEQRLDFVSRQGRQLTMALEVLDRGGTVEEASAVARGESSESEMSTRSEVRERLQDTDRERIMQLMAEHMPGLHTRLQALYERDPDSADQMLTRLGGHLLEAFREKLVDDEMGTAKLLELRASWGVLDVVQQIRVAHETGGDEAAMALKPELVEAISRQFVAKKRLADLELERLRDRVATLESRSAEQAVGSQARFEAMAEQLTQRAVGRGKRHGGREAQSDPAGGGAAESRDKPGRRRPNGDG